MDEHDDDLTSEVQDEAAEETDSFPSTGDDLDDADDDEASEAFNGESEDLDEDASEL